MTRSVRVALIGDYRASAVAHQAIPPAIQFAAKALSLNVTADWIATPDLDQYARHDYTVIWMVHGSFAADRPQRTCFERRIRQRARLCFRPFGFVF